MNDLEKIEAKILRGDILKSLEVVRGQDEFMGAATLSAILTDGGWAIAYPNLQQHCLYLAEKGYLAYKTSKVATITMFLVRLTPHGRDLVEGNIDADPGITL